MATTGHKSEASIHSYATKCPPKKRHYMSDSLATALVQLDQPSKIPKKTPSASIASEAPSTIDSGKANF